VDNVHVIPESTDLDSKFVASFGEFQDELNKVAEVIKFRCNLKEEDNTECPTLPPRPDRYDPVTRELLVPFDGDIHSSPTARTGKVVKAPPISAALKREKNAIRDGPRLVKMLTMPVWVRVISRHTLLILILKYTEQAL